MGNGYPVVTLVTTNKIASTLGDYTLIHYNGSIFLTRSTLFVYLDLFFCLHITHLQLGGNPIACAVGTAVLEVIAKENFVPLYKNVGEINYGRITTVDGYFILFFNWMGYRVGFEGSG